MVPAIFTAKIYKVGINPCIDVPPRISQLFRRTGYIPVKGTLNNITIRSTLVPTGGGNYRLFINEGMRMRAKVGPGDRIALKLVIDNQPPRSVMPQELAQALKSMPKAQQTWLALSDSRRKEVLAYLNNLKSSVALERNIQKLLGHLDPAKKSKKYLVVSVADLLSGDKINNLAQPANFKLGQQIAAAGGVAFLSLKPHDVVAHVTNGQRRTSQFHASAAGLTWKCTCSTDPGLFCKHLVAAGLAMATASRFEQS